MVTRSSLVAGLVWPPILILIARIRPHLLTRVLAALVVGVLLEKIALLAWGASDNRLYFGPDTHADPILIGCLFGSIFASGGIPRVIERWRQLVGPLSLVLIVGIIALPPELSPFKAISPARVFFAIACGLLILSASGGSTAERLLSVRPLPFLGQISYSLYLWHVPVLAALAATADDERRLRSALAIGLTIGVATASFRFVERPLRRRWREPRQRQPGLRPSPAVVGAAVRAE